MIANKERFLPLTEIPIEIENVSKCIFTVRGCQVMMDCDLAQIYKVETKALKRAVRRNINRFPADFMFELTKDEARILRFQPGTPTNAIETHGGNRYAPFVFTEPGVAMLSSVLHTEKAIQINIEVMRVFIRLRALFSQNDGDLRPMFDSPQKGIVEVHHKLDHLSSNIKTKEKPERSINEPNKMQVIKELVAKYWSLSPNDLKSPKRTKLISLARQVSIYFMRKYLGMSYTEIGHHLGQRDHTTILHAYRKIHVDSEDNKIIREAISNILANFQKLT